MSAWLWPDRAITKRESKRLREEYNHLYNAAFKLVAGVKVWRMLNGINMGDNPFVHADMQDAVESLRQIVEGSRLGRHLDRRRGRHLGRR